MRTSIFLAWVTVYGMTLVLCWKLESLETRTADLNRHADELLKSTEALDHAVLELEKRIERLDTQPQPPPLQPSH
jgi:hypothetical protein